LFYLAFIFSLTELTTAIPDAGGPYAYAQRALGKRWGHLTAILTLIEFVFAPPAIAYMTGGYLKAIAAEFHLFSEMPSDTTVALILMIMFGVLNLFSIQFSARFELLVTILAVGGLIAFFVVLFPYFKWENFSKNGWENGAKGVFASIPYAVWFFLGIEGVAMTSEEVKNPKRNIPIGYITGVITLVVLAVGVMFAIGGVGDWKEFGPETSENLYPLPKAVKIALGEKHPAVMAFAGIGLFGLVASLNGLLLGATRQLFAVSRARILPYRLSSVNRFASPYLCVIAMTAVGAISILIGTYTQLLTLSGIGATAMYSMCMISLFVLRKKEPEMNRPFTVAFYPFVPGFAALIGLVSFVAMSYYNLQLALITLGIVIGGMILMSFTKE
jgi:ethanolamine permease